MSYTAKPPFNVPSSAQNQSQQAAPGGRDPPPQIHLSAQNPSAAAQNAPTIANNAANSLLTNQIYQQHHQQQQLLQQQLLLQSLHQQQHQHQPVNAAALAQRMVEFQKSFGATGQPPNGNLNALTPTQQIQQLVQLTSGQPGANLLNYFQQAQAQAQQQQQQVPLPSNTTITPVSRQQNYLPSAAVANQQRPAASYSPAKPSQNKQVPATQARRNVHNLPKPTSVLPPSMPSQVNLKTNSAANYTAAKLAPGNVSSNYSGVANVVKTAIVPPSLPSVSISKVPPGDIGNASKTVAGIANSTNKPSPHSPAKLITSVGPSMAVSPLKQDKVSPGPKINTQVSPRTKQTPRKNCNPIKAANPVVGSGAGVAATSAPIATISAIAVPPSSTVSKAPAKVPTPPKPVPVVQSNRTVSKLNVATTVSKPSAVVAPTVSTTATNPSPQKHLDEKSAKTLSTAPTKPNVATPRATAVKKPATTPAANNTSSPVAADGNVDSKKSPATQVSKPSAQPKATVAKATSASTSTPKQDKKTSPVASASKLTTPTSVDRIKRNRLRAIPYQSPLPEIERIKKMTASEANNSSKNSEDNLIIFYRNEFLAVRNDEGGFFLCQAIQNVYKSSPRIRIRWLSEEKSNQGLYTLDFYDHTDIECVLTTVSLDKQSKGKFELAKTERERVQSILQKALDVEKGVVPRPNVTEENPDGLDLSLYKNESQIEKKSPVKRKASESKPTSASAAKKKASQIKEKSNDSDSDGPSAKRMEASKRAPATPSVKDKAPAAKTIPTPKSATKSDSKSTKDINVQTSPKTTVKTPAPKASDLAKDKPKPEVTKVTKTSTPSEKPTVAASSSGGSRATRRTRV